MTNPETIAILGGDPIVGQTLELLLGGNGHVARFLAEPVKGEPLAGVGLLLLRPA